jgi:hypothetical protein
MVLKKITAHNFELFYVLSKYKKISMTELSKKE